MAEIVEILRIEVDNESAQKAVVAYERSLVKLKTVQAAFRKELKASNGENKKAAEGLVQVNKQISQNNIKRKELTKSINTQSNSLQALRNNLAKNVRLRNQVNTATATGKKRFDELNRSILKQNNSLKKAEQAGGDFRRSVGNYGTALQAIPGPIGFVISGLQRMGAALKAVGLGVGLAIAGIGVMIAIFVRAIRGAKGFQAANAELAGVLGKTRAEIVLLREDAKRLGSTTAFTATQVTRLQISLSKLGFEEQSILNISKAIINLSVAAKQSADIVATFVGGVIKQFKLLTTEADNIADVSAKAFSSSALDFQKLSEAGAIVGTTSRIAGEGFVSMTAKLGVLADNMIPATVAATALRNIYIDLAGKGLTWEEAMGEINVPQNKLTTAFDLFGKRGAAVANILAENSSQIAILEGKLNDAGGAVQKLVDEQLDTLEGKLILLRSAWDGLFLSIEDGEGLLSKISETVVEFATQFVNEITLLSGILGDEDIGFLGKMKMLGTLATSSSEEINKMAESLNKVSKAITSLGAGEMVLEIAEVTAEINTLNTRLELSNVQFKIFEKTLSPKQIREFKQEQIELNSALADAEERKRNLVLVNEAMNVSLRETNEIEEQNEEDKIVRDESAQTREEARIERELTFFELLWDAKNKQLDQEKSNDKILSGIRAKRLLETERNAAREIEIEKLKNETILFGTASILGSIAGLFKRTSVAFKLGKIAEATISAYTAITESPGSNSYRCNHI